MRFLNLFLVMLCAMSASALEGDWRGKIDMGAAKLSIVFHFKQNPPSCTMDSPDQGAKGIPASVTYCTGDSLAVFMPTLMASFNGKISGGVISGTFKQSGYSFPLTLEPESDETIRRPQTPLPPYPYKEEDIEIEADGAVLSATFVLPENPKAAVVFVSGSGAQNRDEEIFEHKPFRLLADRLARAGIASLRYDDRGTAESTGNFAAATTDTFRNDAAAAISSLRKLSPRCPVGVIGHSEGGMIAFMLAAEGIVDFAVSLAGPAQPGIDIIIEQNRDVLIASGFTNTDFDHSLIFIESFLREMAAGKKTSPRNIAKEKKLSVPEALLLQTEQQLKQPLDAWFVSFLNIKPAEYIAKIKCPLLALNGTLDTQVKSTLNLPIIRGLQPKAVVKEYDGLNHLFQHASTGAVTEYGEISETFAEEAIADIISFIIKSL